MVSVAYEIIRKTVGHKKHKTARNDRGCKVNPNQPVTNRSGPTARMHLLKMNVKLCRRAVKSELKELIKRGKSEFEAQTCCVCVCVCVCVHMCVRFAILESYKERERATS